MRTLSEENGNQRRLIVEEDDIIIGDYNLLDRAFENLRLNAIIYSFPNTEIRITIEQQKEYMHIQFFNHCYLLTTHQLLSRFIDEYRLEEAYAIYPEGTGQGLTIVKEILKEHSGEIEAKSLSNSILFNITLPIN